MSFSVYSVSEKFKHSTLLVCSIISCCLFGQVSSVEIERICNGVDSSILETAAIGVPPSGGGPELLTIAVVFKDSNSTNQDLHQLRMSFNSALQKKLNPLFRVVIIFFFRKTASFICTMVTLRLKEC